MVIYEVLPILKPSPPSRSGQTVAQVRAREYTRVRARVSYNTKQQQRRSTVKSSHHTKHHQMPV